MQRVTYEVSVTGTDAWEIYSEEEWKLEEEQNQDLDIGETTNKYYFHHFFISALEQHMYDLIGCTNGPGNAWSYVPKDPEITDRLADQLKHVMQNFWTYRSYREPYKMGRTYGELIRTERGFRLNRCSFKLGSTKSRRLRMYGLDEILNTVEMPDLPSQIFRPVEELVSQGLATPINSITRDPKGKYLYIRTHPLKDVLEWMGSPGECLLDRPYSTLQADNADALHPVFREFVREAVERLTGKRLRQVDFFLNESGNITPPHTDIDTINSFLWLFGGFKLWSTCGGRSTCNRLGNCTCGQYLLIQCPGQLILLGRHTKHAVASIGPQDCWGLSGWLDSPSDRSG